ncbi:MAG: SDR family oxidoreductase [Planctomycetota bacterium]|jgi:NAD(P)-dependent dehydrogenase (short-subunit alcohol dehydrogenase family)|nr:SDR family oxidoreductase [Planctomycetota bacterium]
MFRKEMFSLAGRTGIVTGGGQGLGRAFCRAYAEMGANVVVAEINPETGAEAAGELRALGVESLFVRTDVTRREDLEAAVEAALGLAGRVDFLHNNAGITLWKEAELVPGDDWRRVWDVNLNSVFLGCQAVFPVMKRQGKGSIVNTASMSARIVNVPQRQASYNASKAGVLHLTRSLAVEWAGYGIRVNCISPGYMNGPMAGRFFDDPEIGPIWRGMTPMRRPGEPEELCGAAVLLASDASSFTTGADFAIDGGFTCV